MGSKKLLAKTKKMIYSGELAMNAITNRHNAPTVSTTINDFFNFTFVSIFQILIYPAVQFMDFSLPSIKKQSSPLLTRDTLAALWSYYITGMPNMAASFLVNNHSMHLRNTKYSSYVGVDDNKQRKQPKKPLDNIPRAVLDGLTDYRASPLMADSLKGLPKTLLITCEHDVLKDDGLLYKARLLGAGVKVTHLNYMTYHGFLSFQSVPLTETEEFPQALRDIIDYLKEL